MNNKNGDKVLDVTFASINKNYYSMIVIPKKCYIIAKYTDDNIFNLKNINFDSNVIVEKK